MRAPQGFRCAVVDARNDPPFGARRSPCHEWLVAAIDEIDYGVIVTDADRRVRLLNHQARARLLSAPHPLELRDGQVHARSVRDARALTTALRGAAVRSRRCLLWLGDTPATANAVTVLPLAAAGAAILMPRSHGSHSLALHWFARWHGLTPAEERVLDELGKGAMPADIALRHEVAISTVRTQIRHIRAKTGTTTVGALLRQVWLLPPIVGALRHAG